MAEQKRDQEEWDEKHVTSRITDVRCRETADRLELEVPMAGARAEGLDVALTGRHLKITFERQEEKRVVTEGRERVDKLKEIRTKEVDLPCDVDPASADAVLKGETLHVSFSKQRTGEPVRVRTEG